jgi:NitT/TauT family transport system permease protein
MKRQAGRRDAMIGLAWVVGVFVAVCVLWEAAVKLLHVPEFILPSIEDVVLDFVAAPRVFLTNALYTLATAVVGFVIATALGLTLAVAIVSSQILDRILMALLALIHSVPKVALAPLFVIWLGTGYEPKIAIAAMTAILVIVVDLVAGMRAVDPEMLSLARVHHASPLSMMFKIRFPHALPHLFGAMKTAISLAVIGAIVGEYVGGQQGLGYVILVAQSSFDTPRAFAAVLLLSIIATALFYLITYAETKLIPWHVSQRSRAGH